MSGLPGLYGCDGLFSDLPSFNSVEMEAEYQSQRLGHETREDYVNRLRGDWSLMSNYFGGDE